MRKEFVAAKIGPTITNDVDKIKEAITLSLHIEWIDRKRIQFMAAADMGKQWEDLANAKTLFFSDEQQGDK